MPILLTQVEIAEEFGISKQRVSQLVRRGMPREPDGRIHLEKAASWMMWALNKTDGENSRARRNAREILGLLARARARGEPDEFYGLSEEEREAARP
jgi:hypothetical protein